MKVVLDRYVCDGRQRAETIEYLALGPFHHFALVARAGLGYEKKECEKVWVRSCKLRSC